MAFFRRFRRANWYLGATLHGCVNAFSVHQRQTTQWTPAKPVNPEKPQLSCLVLSHDDEHHKQISQWLGVSKRVGLVTAVDNEKSLSQHLVNTRYHLCVIVVDNREQTLPGRILRYPDTVSYTHLTLPTILLV